MSASYTDPSGFCIEPISAIFSCQSIVFGALGAIGDWLFGGGAAPPPPPKGCWAIATGCYGAASSSKMVEIVSDAVIIRFPKVRTPVWHQKSRFGSGPCGKYCLTLDGEGWAPIEDSGFDTVDRTPLSSYIKKLLIDEEFLKVLRKASGRISSRIDNEATDNVYDGPVLLRRQEMGAIIYKDEHLFSRTTYHHSRPLRIITSGAQDAIELARHGGITEMYNATYKIDGDDVVAIFAIYPSNVAVDIEDIRRTLLANEYRRPFFISRFDKVYVIHGTMGPWEVTEFIR